MKTRNILALSAAAVLLISSCSSDEAVIQPSADNTLHITAAVGHGTRTNPEADGEAAYAFETGDKLLVFAGRNIESSDIQKAVFTFDGTRWTTTDRIVWTDSIMDVYALFPADRDLTNMTLPTDQSTKEKLVAADFMDAEDPITHKISDGSTADLLMVRNTARVSFTVSVNDDYKALNPQVKNVVVRAVSDLMAAPIGPPVESPMTRNPAQSPMSDFMPYADGNVYTVLTAYTPAAPGQAFIKLQVQTDEGLRNMEVTGIPELRIGYSYNYKLNLGRNNITIDQVSIAPWTDGGSTEHEAESLLTIDRENNIISMTHPGILTKDDISRAAGTSRNLSICGPINGTDIVALRDAIGINPDKESLVDNLDLSKANIVSGGASYSFVHPSAIGVYNTENRIIGPSMFEGAQIKTLVIPDDTKIIKEFCIAGSTLEKITFNNSLDSIFGNALAGWNEKNTANPDANKIKVFDFPASVRYIGMNVLMFSPNCEKVIIRMKANAFNEEEIVDGSAFSFITASPSPQLILDDSWWDGHQAHVPSQDAGQHWIWKNGYRTEDYWSGVMKLSEYEVKP